MKVQTKRLNRNEKPFVKNPVADSLCTPFHTFPSLREKSDESQLSACNSVKPKTAPTHSFVGSSVRHLPSAETNHATIVALFVDEKVFRRTKHLVDSLVAVFADVGNTFKGSKNFADHIFYKLRLSGNKVHVKGKNFAITVRNDSGRLKTFLDSFFGDANESGSQTLAGMGKIREAVAVYRLKDQFVSHVFGFVFHGDTLTVREEVGNNFFRFFDRIFVEFVQIAPVGLVVHEFMNAPFSIAKGNLEGHDVVDVNFSFNFHAYSMRQKSAVVNRLLFVWDGIFAKNFVLTFLAHTADVVFLDAERVAENVSPFSTGDAGATSNRERASATQAAEADVVQCGGH